MIKVVIIDDEEIIREGLRKIIDWNSMNCEIIGEAEDGEDGLELINSLQPDIIVTDIRMSSKSGLEMISEIKSIKEDCRIIILTGFRDFEYAREALKLGAFRYLLKPSKVDEITQAIKDAIKEIKKVKEKKEHYKLLVKRANEIQGSRKYYLQDFLDPNDNNNDGPDGTNSKGNGNEVSESSKNSKYLVNRALIYLRENYSKNINLKTLSEELYISTWYLSKLLKKETGSNFIDILNNIRVEEAKKLLGDPKYKIYEIAEVVGFSDVTYFYRLFKKLTGMTPMEYKNSML
ncbi:response regulator transcription factor [Pseudobacteroides cellulosolvens]|uniref:Stage 0 sporulation protein A homolog n=1 Tax=Pseudobacteroides cellulosolvens ATCC 35603 = DSM 2933 TaxID=398512 RepID=A0A0L6JM37_9FIRM|nr:response regulator [Pseudobacteroides cellulosolvens]KNY26467.1 two component transcriptional regulator, AraC family [Pseudobacteroides cellulosolvens ATCC 35603 = DSM 2933]